MQAMAAVWGAPPKASQGVWGAPPPQRWQASARPPARVAPPPPPASGIPAAQAQAAAKRGAPPKSSSMTPPPTPPPGPQKASGENRLLQAPPKAHASKEAAKVGASSAKAAAPPKAAQAFAILPTDSGPVLAPPSVVNGMLRADWTLFLELANYALFGGHGPCRIAYGTEEVAEAIDQAAVAVLFIPVSCGHGGEAAVRGVAMAGGRGYIVGASHELYESVDDWGAAALLHYPLIRRALGDDGLEPTEAPKKRAKVEDTTAALAAATAKSASLAGPPAVKGAIEESTAQPVEVASFQLSEKDLKKELKYLGKAAGLEDKTSIPRTTEAIRSQYLSQLGANAVFRTCAEMFGEAKVAAHRKALLYVVHELFMGKKGVAMKPQERRQSCVRNFFMRIGSSVKSFRTDEREGYIKAVTIWETARVLLPSEVAQIKDAWDMD